MRRIPCCWYLALLAVAPAMSGCAKKAPSAAAAAAEGPGKYLPPGANAYVAIDVKTALASAAVAPHKALLLMAAPSECTPVIDALQRVTIGAYGTGDRALMIFPHKVRDGEPRPDDQVVMVIEGPAREPLLACLDALALRDGETPPPPSTETRAGIEIRTIGGSGKLLFSVGDTTHVVASPATLDAALAAAAGGPSIDGSPALEALPHVAAGTIVVGIVLPPEMAQGVVGDALGPFAGGRPVPAPHELAVSLVLGADIAVQAALLLADDAAAQTFAQAAQALVAKFKGLATAAGAATGSWGAALIKEATVDRAGSVVTIGTHFGTDALVQAFFAPGERREQPAPAPQP